LTILCYCEEQLLGPGGCKKDSILQNGKKVYCKNVMGLVELEIVQSGQELLDLPEVS